MKHLFFVLTLILSSSALAAQILCQGSYTDGTQFVVKTSLANANQITDTIYVSYTRNGQTKQSNLTTTGSRIDLKDSLWFAGSNERGSGELRAEFDENTGLYDGILTARSGLIRFQVSVSCRIR